MEYQKEKIQIQKALRTAKLNEETKKEKLRKRMANKMLWTYRFVKALPEGSHHLPRVSPILPTRNTYPFSRAKDKRLAEKVQNTKKSLLEKEREKELLAEQLADRFRRKIPVARDPVRVHNWTFEWRQKVKYDDGVDHTEDIYFFKEPLSITNIPHL